jgi:hypothetical protein
MTADRPEPTAAPAGDSRPAEPFPDEVDLWWGSFSPWTMLPSFLVCLLLTGLIVWAAWYFVPRGWVQVTALAGASVVWVVQFFRWAGRVFGETYRLTTRRLLWARGLRNTRLRAVELVKVTRIAVWRGWWETRAGVGRIVVEEEPGQEPVVLEGVRMPAQAAERIRDAVKSARGEKE